jgi:hypothetical protein
LTILLGVILWKATALNFWYGLSIIIAFHALVFYFIGYTLDERRAVFVGIENKWQGINKFFHSFFA